jgi:hypothetical protein
MGMRVCKGKEMRVVRARLEGREVLVVVEMADPIANMLHQDGYEMRFMGIKDTLVHFAVLT